MKAKESEVKAGTTVGNFFIDEIKTEKDGAGVSRKFAYVTCLDCGNKKRSRLISILNRKNKSCVCATEGRYQKTHGMYRTSTYNCYRSMIQRCYDKNSTGYRLYGGRGIGVSDDWLLGFGNFYRDMGDKPKGMSIDRIDVNKGYSKENCRWETASNQAHNKRPLTKGFKGVCCRRGKFISRISINYKDINLGIFDCPIKAALAYDKKAKELRGCSASTNESLGLFGDKKIKEVVGHYNDSYGLQLTKPDDLYWQALMRNEK